MPDARHNYSELDDEWEVDLENSVFTSKIHSGRDDQRLVFDEPFRDGEVSAEITPVSFGKAESGDESKTGSLLFRYLDPNNYYIAGIGGFGGRFTIGKMVKGQTQPLAISGNSKSIKRGVPFRVQVGCTGSRITLQHNKITQISVVDDSFKSGPWGLSSWRASCTFKNPTAQTFQPVCFVIMPFDKEFDKVYQVIRESVDRHGYECIRADQRYVSGTIMEDVAERIEQADLIVADFTHKNPNVFYEAGYAMALRKPVIQIAQSVSDLPFDVRHLRVFSYNTDYLGDRKLASDLGEAIKAATGFGAVGNGRVAAGV